MSGGNKMVYGLPSKESLQHDLKDKITSIETYKESPSTYTAHLKNAHAEILAEFSPKSLDIFIDGYPISSFKGNFIIGKKLSDSLHCKLESPHRLLCETAIKTPFVLTINRKQGFVGIELEDGDMLWVK